MGLLSPKNKVNKTGEVTEKYIKMKSYEINNLTRKKETFLNLPWQLLYSTL